MKKSDTLIYYLPVWIVIFLYLYYLVWIAGGMWGVKLILDSILSELKQDQIIKQSFNVSLAISGMLCGVQYIRRLYKACLTDRIKEDKDCIKCIGNLAYFVFRPVFACVFTLIMIFALLSGMTLVTGSLDYILIKKFIYLCAMLASYTGFSVGKVMDKFEKNSEETITDIQ